MSASRKYLWPVCIAAFTLYIFLFREGVIYKKEGSSNRIYRKQQGWDQHYITMMYLLKFIFRICTFLFLLRFSKIQFLRENMLKFLILQICSQNKLQWHFCIILKGEVILDFWREFLEHVFVKAFVIFVYLRKCDFRENETKIFPSPIIPALLITTSCTRSDV
jgi:hypothetical protein